MNPSSANLSILLGGECKLPFDLLPGLRLTSIFQPSSSRPSLRKLPSLPLSWLPLSLATRNPRATGWFCADASPVFISPRESVCPHQNLSLMLPLPSQHWRQRSDEWRPRPVPAAHARTRTCPRPLHGVLRPKRREEAGGGGNPGGRAFGSRGGCVAYYVLDVAASIHRRSVNKRPVQSFLS